MLFSSYLHLAIEQTVILWRGRGMADRLKRCVILFISSIVDIIYIFKQTYQLYVLVCFCYIIDVLQSGKRGSRVALIPFTTAHMGTCTACVYEQVHIQHVLSYCNINYCLHGGIFQRWWATVRLLVPVKRVSSGHRLGVGDL